jgi:NADH-quinone oxidoreductase subunit I
MGYLLDGFRALGVTIRNVFRRTVTFEYPKVKRARAERYRNSFALRHDEHGEPACNGCGACAQICPSRVITVVQGPKVVSEVTGKKRGTTESYTLDLNGCIFCELCVQVCPTDAIVMCRVPQTPAYSREELCLTMDKLYVNEKEKGLAWGRGSLLREMQDPKRGKAAPARKKKAASKAADEPKKAAARADDRQEEKAEAAADGPKKAAARADDRPEEKAEAAADGPKKAAARADDRPEEKAEAAADEPARAADGEPVVPPPPKVFAPPPTKPPAKEREGTA